MTLNFKNVFVNADEQTKKWWLVFFLILLVFLAYFNSLTNNFVSDDITAILQNKDITKGSYIFSSPQVFLRTFFLAIIAKIFGLNPIFYRLLNLIFHLGTVLIAYFLISRLINYKTAFFAAAILAIHPLQIEAVTWISGGPYSQYSFFFLLSLFFYILSSANKKFYFASLGSFVLCLLSNEKAMTFPLVLFLFILCFEGINPVRNSRFLNGVKKNWKKIIPFLIIILIWGSVFLLTTGGVEKRVIDLESAQYQEIKFYNPLIQVPIAITSYLELIFWPKDLTLYHSEMSFKKIEYLVRLIIFILFLGLIIYSFKKNRQVFFWLSFFIITLLPTLTPFAISWVVAERYVYLGAIGIYVAIAIFLEKISKPPHQSFLKKLWCGGKLKNLNLAVNVVFCLIIALLLTRTFFRNIDWKNEDNLWIATAKTSPSSPNTHNNMGDVYVRHNEYEKAVLEFKKAIKINPRYAEAYHNLANVYLKMNKNEEAIKNYEKALSFNPHLWQSYQNLGSIYFKLEKYDLSLESFQKSIKINDKVPELHVNLGIVYLKINNKEKAKEEFKKALELDPNNEKIKQILSTLK